MEKGQIVSLKINGEKVYGWVRTAPTATPSGEVVSVELLPDFAHLLPTGWTDAGVDDLEPAKVCGCAILGQRREGKLFTTGCDFSRTPKGAFLPGHDARAKSFLIKAWGHGPLLGGFEHSLDANLPFSDKIRAKVAEGIDNARARDHKRVTSRRWRQQVERPEVPAVREDEMTPAMRLCRELGVTDPMREALAYALVHRDGGVYGTPTGTVVALQKRGLVEKGGREVTRLGRQAMDFDELENPTCTPSADYADEGTYASHWNTWNHEVGYHCRRCGAVDADQ